MPFPGLLFVCLLFSPKRVFPADKQNLSLINPWLMQTNLIHKQFFVTIF